MRSTVLFVFFCAGLLVTNWLYAAPIWSNNTAGGDDYLVGTIHLGDQRLSGLPSKIIQAIDKVDAVVLEVDLAKVSPQEQQRVISKYGLLPAGQTLQSVLSGSVYMQAKQYLAQQGLDIQQFQQFRPWMLGLTMVQVAYARQGLDINHGIDKQIADYASLQNKQIIGLETFEQQMRFFEQIFKQNSAITNDDLILDTLKELREYRDMPLEMLDAWLAGDMAVFEKIYKDTLGQSAFDKAAEKILLSERNQVWAEQLDPLVKNKKVLVAVGTLHLAGENALNKLLTDTFVQF
ncbi:MAG: TraB/GumN family protein [Gammaproteobacteria bacterium]|nr:TraB/GumN family protein [Gammaproteobacteria bacterium]